MGRNRYRVLEVSGQFQSIGIADKSDTDTEYFRYYFDTFPILYILVYIIMMSCNKIQTEHNTLRFNVTE